MIPLAGTTSAEVHGRRHRNRMKFGVPVTGVICLGHIDGLDRIEEREGELHLSAWVTHDSLAVVCHSQVTCRSAMNHSS